MEHEPFTWIGALGLPEKIATGGLVAALLVVFAVQVSRKLGATEAALDPEDGITARNLAEAVPPHVKSLNFLNNILAKMEAKAAGAYEGLLLNHAGAVTEGTTSNIFLVQRGRLRTPSLDCGILEGITRSLVLRLARELSIPSEERVVTADDLFNADECFLTNTTQEILPVREIDGRVLADGRPGPMTRRLHTSFRSGLDRFLDRV